jgi:preprotein translocase subunit YajC
MSKILSLITALGAGCLALPAMVFGDEGAAPAGRDGSYWQMLIMVGIAIAFFYLIVLRPEKKRRKAAQERRNAMKKGDRVTAMGIIGHIHQIKEDTVVLRLCEGAKMEVLKATVSDVQPATEEEAPRAEKEAGSCCDSKRVELSRE